jgi:hypothetical protein
VAAELRDWEDVAAAEGLTGQPPAVEAAEPQATAPSATAT